ncbi:MAG TPA: hypothetical protein VL463_31090 [Kofleriaceae bacterium]|jgi:hypothetical protein|nr:hypothetical protein [Kofleriaceae bacterium]
MDDERNLPVLRREVLPPPSTSSGWGLIMVAATALSFALAGSLLMVRATAEIARERTTMPVIVDIPPAALPANEVRSVRLEHAPKLETPTAACAGPVYHANGDGHAEAVFELCPPKSGHIKRIVAD